MYQVQRLSAHSYRVFVMENTWALVLKPLLGNEIASPTLRPICSAQQPFSLYQSCEKYFREKANAQSAYFIGLVFTAGHSGQAHTVRKNSCRQRIRLKACTRCAPAALKTENKKLEHPQL